MEEFQIIKCENPFNRRDRVVSKKHYSRDLTLLDIYCEEIPSAIDVSISLNGKFIPSREWDKTYFRPGDQILIVPILEGGGDSGKNPLGTILMIAVAVIATIVTYGGAAPYLGAAFAAGEIGAGLLGAGIMIVGGLLVNALVPYSPTQKSMDSIDVSTSQNYSWNPTTVQQQGIVIPHCYGLNKVYGNIIAGFLDNVNEKNFATILISLGIGPVNRIYDFKINDQLVKEEVDNFETTNFKGTLIEVRYGTLGQTVIRNLNDTKIESALSGSKLKYGEYYTYQTTREDFDELEVKIVAPSGIYYLTDTGEQQSIGVPVTVEIQKEGEETWTNISTTYEDRIIITDGEVYRWSLGRDEMRMFGFMEWVWEWYEYEVGTTNPSDHYEGEESGPYHWKWIVGKNYFVAAYPMLSTNIIGNKGNPISFTFRSSKNLEHGKYNVRVNRLAVEYGLSNRRYSDALYVSFVTQIYYDDFSYPRIALVGIKSLATENISGSLKFSCMMEGKKIRVYDSDTSTWSVEYSNNPAWVCYDILSQPIINDDLSIARYDGYDPTYLDYIKFAEWATWCDEIVQGTKRITFNGIFDNEMTVWDAALKVCEIGRAALVWNGTMLTVVVDKAGTETQLFTLGNIGVDSFKESFLGFNERAGEIEVDFINSERDYERDQYTLVSSDIAKPSSKVNIQLMGCTNSAEAWRHAKYRLLCNQYLLRSIEFNADIDAIACSVGDIIRVQHAVPQWGYGGRLVSATENTVTLDQSVTLEEGKSYELLVRLSDDSIAEKVVLGGVSTPDLLDEDCSDISDWTDGDSGGAESSVDPAGQFKFDTGDRADEGSPFAQRYRVISAPPDKFTIEFKTYFDALGTIVNSDFFYMTYRSSTWWLEVIMTSDHMSIRKAGVANYTYFYGVVKCNASAAWQVWRFQVDKSAGEDAATVEVFLDGVSLGTCDCDYKLAGTNGFIQFVQNGYTTDHRILHIDYIKIWTGLLSKGSFTTLQTTSAFTTTPSQFDLFAFGETDISYKPFRVIGMRKSSEQQITISAVEYNSNIYTGDDGSPIQPTIQYSALSKFVEVTNLSLAQETYLDDSENLRIRIIAKWDVGTNTIYKGARIDVKVVEGTSIYSTYMGTIVEGTTIAYIEGIYVGRTYRIYVRGINFTGLRIPFSSAPYEDITIEKNPRFYDATLKIKVSGLQIFGRSNSNEFTGRDCKLIWNSISAIIYGEHANSSGSIISYGSTNIWLKDYEVKVFNIDGTLRRTEYVKVNEYVYTYEKNAEDGTVVNTFKIEVRTRNVIGGISLNPAKLTVINTAPASIASITVNAHEDGVTFSWLVSGETDIRGYNVRSRVDSGDWSDWTEIPVNNYTRNLTADEKANQAWGNSIIDFEAQPVDVFGQYSTGLATAQGICLNQKPYITVGVTTVLGDFTSLETAISKLPSGGGRIVIKNGIYQMTGELVLPDKNLVIEGESQEGVILKNKAGSNLFVLHNLTKNYSFKQFSIESQNIATYSKMFYIYGDVAANNTAKCLFENLSITLIDDGSETSSKGDHGIDSSVSDVGSILNCSKVNITDGASGIETSQFGGTIIVRDGVFSSQKEYGIELFCNDWLVSGMLLEDQRGLIGLYANSGDRGVFDSNIVNMLNSAVAGGAVTIYGIYAGTANDISIVNNSVISSGVGDRYEIGSIVVNNVSRGIVKGNKVIVDMTSSQIARGVYVMSNANHVVVEGNNIKLDNSNHSQGTMGIHIGGDYNAVIGNNIDCTNSDANDKGIYINGDYNSGIENMFLSCGVNISDVGTSNKINVSGKAAF